REAGQRSGKRRDVLRELAQSHERHAGRRPGGRHDRERRPVMPSLLADCPYGLRQLRKSGGGYHAMRCLSLKKPPVGPPSGSVASHSVVSTPCCTDRGAEAPPMSVRTQPGSTALTSTPLPA